MAAAALCPLAVAFGQALEDLIGNRITEQIQSQVFDSVEQQIEAGVADGIERQIESRVADGIEQQIEERVADGVEQQIASSVADGVEQQIASRVAEGVEQQIASSVADGVERQIASSVADGVEQQIASSVADGVEQQIASNVADGAEQQIAAGVADAVEQQVAQSVTDGVAAGVQSAVSQTIAARLEAGVAGQGVEQAVTDDAARQLERVVRGLVEVRLSEANDALESALGTSASLGLDGQLDGQSDPGQAVRQAIRQALSETAGASQGGGGNGSGTGSDGADDAEAEDESDDTAGETAVAERFVAAVEDSGAAIERDVWILLVPPQHADRIDGWGFDIQERQTLPALNRELVRISAPVDRELAEAALELAVDAPGTVVDFNHVYGGQFAADEGDGARQERAAGRPATARAAAAARSPDGAGGRSLDAASAGSPDAAAGRSADTFAGRIDLAAAPAANAGRGIAIGLIDTAVDADHEAFGGASIVHRDFVPYDAERPLRHGTAVASILLGEGQRLNAAPRGRRAGVTLYAASVFFEDEAGNVLSTTESLVAALDWLHRHDVPVVNMSLSGPPNRVLEAALDTLTGQGGIVVAAVGNNGPAGEPLYPAAYESVVGITAVDASNRVYRFANRGRQVAFAAPGVAVEVARAGGGFGTETGTSMAAPHAAALIVQSLYRTVRASGEVLAALKATAIDLGEADFDETYGYGLIVAEDLSAGAQP